MANFVSPYITILTLPGSLVGKSPDLNAEPHNFFISHTYYLVVTHIPISDYLGTSKNIHKMPN